MNDLEKLKKIEQTIRGHYFNQRCKHDEYNGCCAVLISEIIEIIGYHPRTTLVTEGQP